jgi:eukaryotic-like serine/threonine-protein kinase
VKPLKGGGRQRLDRYELIAELASGGMATVYVGRDLKAKGFNRFVAVKMLHAHLAGEKEFVDMFELEAGLAMSLRHVNVVPILDIGHTQQGHYLVMEYVEGDTLARFLTHTTLVGEQIPIGIAIRIVLDTLLGLHAAHELKDENDRTINLVHRDVSPQNILVGTDGTSRITDFGVARAATSISTLKAGQLKGKLAYMAPEQARGAHLDRRADVFAVGTVLWEVLAGRRLFKGETEAETLNRIMFEPIPRLREVAPMLPVALDVVTMQAIERDPTKRFGNAAIFADELERAARSIHAVAEPRDVAKYVEAVLGTEIQQKREMIRALLAQADTTSPGIGAPAVPASGRGASSVSSAAVSLPVDFGSADYSSASGRNAYAAGRSKRRSAVLGFVLLGALVAAGVAGWSALNKEPVSTNAAAPAISPTPTPTATPPATSAPSAAEAPRATPSAKPAASAPVTTSPPPHQVAPRPNVAPVPRRQRPAAPATAQPARPAAPDDIPSNPYR